MRLIDAKRARELLLQALPPSWRESDGDYNYRRAGVRAGMRSALAILDAAPIHGNDDAMRLIDAEKVVGHLLRPVPDSWQESDGDRDIWLVGIREGFRHAAFILSAMPTVTLAEVGADG